MTESPEFYPTLTAKEYWDVRYRAGKNSGYGSYGDQKDLKMKLLSGLNVSSITSVGCGDFYFDSHLIDDVYPNATYIGLDQSEVIINRNKGIYPNTDFRVFTGEIPQADLVVCLDVLFHIYEENEVNDLLGKLEGSWTKYLALTAYERDKQTHPKGHVRIRKFDPARFGEPVIREVVERVDDLCLYFYLFKKND